MKNDPSRSPLRKRYAELPGHSLRMRARALSDGMHGGVHRANRKGSGIEFAGHRPYTPGDDLRHLDRHALLRHGRLLLREFHTDTERAVHLIVDASASMAFRGEQAEWSKLRHAALLAAAIAFIARKTGDPVGLSIVGESPAQSSTDLPRLGGESFERVLGKLEELDRRRENEHDEVPASHAGESWMLVLREVGARLQRGAIVVLLSDLLDLDDSLAREIASLCTKRRQVVALQVLDPAEVRFPFEGPIVLKDSETAAEVETDALSVRRLYLERLEQLTDEARRHLLARGGRFLRVVTDEDAVATLQSTLTPAHSA